MVLTYGTAHLGKSLFWYSSELLFAYYLTEYAGLTGYQMGLAIAIGFLAAALIDVTAGRIFRKALTSDRSAGRLQLAGAVFSSASLVTIFLVAWVEPEWRFAYSIAAGLVFRISFSIYDLPQNALMALITRSSQERKALAATRIWFSGKATLIVASVVGPLIAFAQSSSGPIMMLTVAGIFSLVAVATAWRLSARIDKSFRGADDPAAVVDENAGRSQTFLVLLLLMVVTSLFTPVFSKLEPYFAAHILQSSWWGGIIILLMSFGIVVGQPLWHRITTARSYLTVMHVAAGLQVVSLAAFAIWGLQAPVAAAAAAFAFGLGNGGVGMALWGEFSEVVSRAGSSFAGISYGLFTATAKVGLAVGAMLVSVIVDTAQSSGFNDATLVTPMALLPGIGAAIVIAFALAGDRSDYRNRTVAELKRR